MSGKIGGYSGIGESLFHRNTQWRRREPQRVYLLLFYRSLQYKNSPWCSVWLIMIPVFIHFTRMDAHFLFPRNAQIKTKIHRAIVHPPNRLTRKIRNVAVAFLPEAMMVGKK